MTHWSRTYLGLPYAARGRTRAGLDCWGLVVLVYASRGITVPAFGDLATDDAELAEISAAAAGEASPWRPVAGGTEREFDVAVFSGLDGRAAPHVGIVLRPGLMLHAYRGARVVTPQDYGAGYWPKCLSGFHRHEGFGDAA